MHSEWHHEKQSQLFGANSVFRNYILDPCVLVLNSQAFVINKILTLVETKHSW